MTASLGLRREATAERGGDGAGALPAPSVSRSNLWELIVMFVNGHPYRELVLFSEARGLPPSRRVAYLDKACVGNVALRQRVEELIQADEQAGNFLHDPAPGAQWPPSLSFKPKAV